MTAPLIPPHNHELEVKTLASVMIDPDGAWPHVSDLPGEAFHSQAARALYRAMTELHAQGLPIDEPELLVQRASENGDDMWVNLAYLTGVLASEITAFYVQHYVSTLRDLHGRREGMDLAFRFAHHAAQGDLPGEELRTLGSQIASALENRRHTGFSTHASAVDAALADIERSTPDALSTGYYDLDNALLGFEPGALYVLAARPAMGKTGLGYSFALNAAKSGHGVVVASLEMSAKQLAMRALATAASVDLSRIRQRTTNGPERERLRSHAARTRSLPITYLEAADQTGLSIARDVRKHHAQGHCDLLLIDYLQLIESGRDGSENRVQEVSTISRNLKKLALELQIPVIVLSQLSRAVETRPNHRPQLSDLRESGAIEQDADIIMFIYRDEYYTKDACKEPGVAEIIIAKQRNGPTGTVKLAFMNAMTRFENLASYSDDF